MRYCPKAAYDQQSGLSLGKPPLRALDPTAKATEPHSIATPTARVVLRRLARTFGMPHKKRTSVAASAGQATYLIGIPAEAAPARAIIKIEKTKLNKSAILIDSRSYCFQSFMAGWLAGVHREPGFTAPYVSRVMYPSVPVPLRKRMV